MPAYNCETTIINTLNSIKASNCLPDEVIIVDDGSLDGTVESINKYQGLTTKIIRKENGGAASARNIGVNEASSKYIFFLDADDEIEIDAIRLMKEHISKTDSDFVFIGETRVRNGVCEYNQAYIDPKNPLIFCLLNDYPSLCMLYKRSSYIKIGGMDESLLAVEDWDLYNRLFVNEYNFTCIDKPIYRYNIQFSNSITKSENGDVSNNVLKSLDEIYTRYFDNLICNTEKVSLKIFDNRLNLTRHYIKQKLPLSSIVKVFIRMIRVNPSLFIKYTYKKVFSLRSNSHFKN